MREAVWSLEFVVWRLRFSSGKRQTSIPKADFAMSKVVCKTGNRMYQQLLLRRNNLCIRALLLSCCILATSKSSVCFFPIFTTEVNESGHGSQPICCYNCCGSPRVKMIDRKGGVLSVVCALGSFTSTDYTRSRLDIGTGLKWVGRDSC